MEFFSKVTHNMHQVVSLFSLVGVGRGDVLVIGNPSKENNT